MNESLRCRVLVFLAETPKSAEKQEVDKGLVFPFQNKVLDRTVALLA